MKNLEQIREYSKETMKKYLDIFDCYRYTDEGIELWLDEWEKKKAPQIEKIAEKSPYYDGNARIVFPVEYPREINPATIRKFSQWLEEKAYDFTEPFDIDGFSYDEVYTSRRFFNNVLSMMDRLEECYKFLSEEEQENYKKVFDENSLKEKANKARNYELQYDSLFDDGTIMYNRDNVIATKTDNYKKIIALSQILNTSYALQQYASSEFVTLIERNIGEKFAKEGQKISRIVNKICKSIGLDKDSEWESQFAKYADAINPLKITKWTVISWNPVDYLLHCYGNSWSSCATPDKNNNLGLDLENSKSSITNYVDSNYHFRGEHAAQFMSYMFDDATFIYYTVNHKYDGTDYSTQPKESRIIFSLNEDMDTLLQGRVYPQCNDDNGDDSAYKIPREIVQKTISDALGRNNLWKVKSGSEVCSDYTRNIGVHYPDWTDYRNVRCNISWSGIDAPKRIKIGHDAICPNCGSWHERVWDLNCYECSENDD